jgi:hypothetical protein
MGLMNPGGLSLIWPLLAQVALTLAVLFVMGLRRRLALMRKDVRVADIALSGEAWPAKARQAANNFANQFETPVLFYVLVIAAIHVGATGPLMTFLAWAFVATRIGHAAIHLTSNNVRTRSAVFSLGVLVLILLLAGILVAAL